MAEPPVDIDRIVREVISQLGLAPDATPPAPAKSSGGGALVLSTRVVTLSEVEGRLEGVRRLVVPPGAAVTPAVRDELHRKNVALEYASSERLPAAGSLRLVMVTAAARFDPATLIAALGKEGINVEHHRADCLIAATDQLAGELAKPERLGLLLTGHPAAGLCLANRRAGVRAVTGGGAGEVSIAAESVGANLLIADPAAATSFQLKQIVTEFCRGGIRRCPEVFRERLA